MRYNLYFLKAFLFTALFTLALSANGQSALRFDLPPDYVTGLTTSDYIYTDLDNDGNLDIAVTNSEPYHQTISILYGKSNGGFETPVVFPAVLIANTLTAGDLNADGLPDIVAGAWVQNKIGVYLNEGNRRFAPPIISEPPDPPFPNSAQFYDLAVGDFNNDGHQDVVAVQDQQGKRLVFFNYSEPGALSVFATLYQPGPGRDSSYEGIMTLGDLNRDGRQDIVFGGGGPFANTNGRNISFVYGQPDGSPAFTFGFNVTDEPKAVRMEDTDNDGDTDLVIAFAGSSNPNIPYVQAFLNNGSGTFTPAAKFYLRELYDMTTGDFNNDGKIDAAVILAVGEVVVLDGIGNGTFGNEKYYLTAQSSRIISGDPNQDGKLDLITASVRVAANNRAIVLLNDNFHGFKAPRTISGGGTFLGTADFNQDGYYDLASTWSSNFISSSTIEILLNDTAGSMFPAPDYSTPRGLSGMKIGDFNGDGKKDIISAHDGSSLEVYLGSDGGIFSQAINTEFNAGVWTLTIGDFNSDGKDDVFFIDEYSKGYLVLSKGDGTFAVAPDFPVTFPAYVTFDLQNGDFNNDGKLDLVIAIGTDVRLWTGNGTGGFNQSTTKVATLEKMVKGDFNGDGNLDLVGGTSTMLMCILGDGHGNFPNSFTYPISGIANSKSLVAADFDLDGFDDFAFLIHDGFLGNIIIFRSGGSAPPWQQPINLLAGSISQAIVAADFNRDGKPDIGYMGSRSRGVIYNITETPRRPQFDYDGDGKADISVFRPTSGIWYINGSQVGFYGTQFGESTDKLVPADYDGDGKTDSAVWRPSTGTWYIDRSSAGYAGVQFGVETDVPFGADFTGDSKAEVAVWRPSTGLWYLYNLGTNIYTTFQFGASTDKPVIGDFDGDGKADYAVFRPSTGIWYIQGSTAGFYAMQFGDADDKLVPADYDGDGKTDIAVWRPSTGIWYIQGSQAGFYSMQFGFGTDLPVPADYDGDGKADIAVFRPTGGFWYIQQSTNGFTGIQFGADTDKPISNAFVQ